MEKKYLYPVMEHFHTIQGEGYYSGRSAYFIRLAGCDVGCVWCDVKESWDASNGEAFDTEEIVSFTENVDFVVITGGEPLQHDLSNLTRELKKQNKYIAIETSGCYPLNGNVDWYVFSPKKFKKPIQEAYTLANELKVVIYHPSDLNWAAEHSHNVNSECLLYLQPEWSKFDEIAPLVVDFVKSNPRWRISLQTHKFLNIP